MRARLTPLLLKRGGGGWGCWALLILMCFNQVVRCWIKLWPTHGGRSQPMCDPEGCATALGAVGLTRGFQLLPSAPQSWDRSHCIVPKVHGVQYVQSEVHHCWHCGGLLCLCSDPISSPCLLLYTLANPKKSRMGPGKQGPCAYLRIHRFCTACASAPGDKTPWATSVTRHGAHATLSA